MKMTSKIRLYINEQIKDLYLNAENAHITIGSSDEDTLKITYPDIIASHLSFDFFNNRWTYFDALKKERGIAKDGDVFILSVKHHIAAMFCVEEHVPQKVKLKSGTTVSIGRSFSATFHLSDRSVSSKHAMVITDEIGSTIKDLHSLNGTFLNNKKISESMLKDGDIISIGKFNILFKNNTLELCENQEIIDNDEIQYPIFSLSPRLRHKMPSEIIEIQEPPNIGDMPMVNWLSFLPMLVTRSAYSAVFPLTSVFSTFLQKKKYRKSREVRQEKYEKYLADVKARIEKNRDDQFISLEESNHETRVCYDIATKRERTMWERNPEDDDFLKVRIGKGDITTSFKIKFPDNVLKMYDDELEEQGENLGQGNQVIEGAPILCDIANNLSVGIIGNRENAVNIARNMIVQIATTHPYTDVRLVTMFSKKEQKQWDFIKWLPHSFDEKRESRYMANDVFNAAALDKKVDEELKGRKPQKDQSEKKNENIPFYLFVISDPELVEDSEIEKYLNENKVGMGIGVIYVYNKLEELPKSCNLIIETTSEENVFFDKSNIGEKQKFEIDKFTIEKANKFARSLAPVRLAEKKSDEKMPTCITFLEGYGVQKAEDLPIWKNWNNTNPAKAVAVPIGIKSNGEKFVFNIMYGSDFLRYHGPFGIVAGTNGSGKSEMMQSWILSLATKFSPQELSFIIIDYKGTGMLLPFQNLPHLAGKISNLDGNVKRNIIALNKEMKRRQAIFNKVGIIPQDIKEYYKRGFHKTYQPLPITILVVDEFAEIKKNLPEFVPVLESLFAVGRSLGIFAVVSTQKPSGVVTDKMYANSKFRWCCRVASSADSKEMLRHADAAKISNAGRAYVQVGEDDIYEQVQSFWSGAPYEPNREEGMNAEIPISLVDITGKRNQYETLNSEKKESKIKEIDAVVDYIEKVAIEHNVEKAPKIWQERLKNRIYLDNILKENNKEQELVLSVGLVDDPYEQMQYPLDINFSADGHCLVWGAPGTGKTTFLQTVIMSAAKTYTPMDINIYAMDFGSWSLNLFGSLPHVGGVANDNDEEKIYKLVNMLKKEIDTRKRNFAMNGIINIKIYEQTTGEKLPFILILIDNFNALFSIYPDLDEFFIKLSREGAAYGIYMIGTVSGISGVSYKIINNIKNNISLQLKDKSEYSAVVGKTDGLEPENNEGRGLIRGTPFALEFQTALPVVGQDDNEVLKNIKSEVSILCENNKDGSAKPIPVMPDVISYNSIMSNDIVLGLSTETIEPVTVDIKKSPHCILISGEKKSGSSNILNVILKQFVDKANAKLILYDSGRQTLSTLARISEKYIESAVELDEYIEKLAEKLNLRKNSEDLSEFDTIVIGIDGYKDMYDAIDDKTATRLSAIVRMGKGLKVFVVVAEESAKLYSLSSVDPILKMIISDGIGILTGGTLKQHGAFKIEAEYSELNEQLSEFEAYKVENEEKVRFKTMYEF